MGIFGKKATARRIPKASSITILESS